ncbi:MAG TPA: protein kinase [Ktedonobacterales bacterium]|nr:protein kinase [Ktedonobacterales bacterium]
MQEWKLGAYQLVRRLGEGGMAQVYLARDVRLGREVAVKVLDRRLADRSGFRERFLREARVAAALDHPNIVPLFDFGEENGILYLVMPYVSGGSLQDELSRTPLPMSEVVTYGTQLTDALAYAHKRNLVHRDVKPANILIHSDGRLMLSDFGLAKILDSGLQPAVARNHPDAGTPEYMAPEQIEGRTEARSDLYGLGVVLYLLMTGQLPFSGSSSNAVMEAHLYRLPESPRRLNPEVTPALELVVFQALAKRPEDRFTTASEMGAALMAALVAGETAPLPFSNPISPLPYSSLPPIAPMPSHAPMTPSRSGGSGIAPGSHNSLAERGTPGPTSGPAPYFDPPLPAMGAALAMPPVGSVGSQDGISPLSGLPGLPGDHSESPRGISPPPGPSLPAGPMSELPMTYRVGEEARLRASQSMDPSERRSAPQPPAAGAALPNTGMVAPNLATPATREVSERSGSRLWIVGVIILLVLLVAAIVLLLMAQSGAFLSL